MKYGKPSFWIAFASGGLVVTLALVDVGRAAPGPLTQVHGGIEELEGRRGCSSCHGGWTSSMAESCLECHAPIEEQLDVGKGLHGSLGADRGMLCAFCHSEHHGASFAIVNSQSFAAAGILDTESFDHALIGYEMSGKHLELSCVECHENAEKTVLDPGDRRFLGLDRNCASCHDDPHEGQMRFDCASCHVQTGFEEHGFVEHAEHLELVGGHAGIDCRTCHAEDERHALETLGRRKAPKARACLDCHESPHERGFVRGVAKMEGEVLARSCELCHIAEHTDFEEGRETLTADWHAQSGFSLGEPHEDVDCASCHDPKRTKFGRRYPGRDADTCAACHDDPHGGQFEQAPYSKEGCISCHARTHFEPHEFGPEEHARTKLPLTGRHAETDCAACHLGEVAQGVRSFTGTDSTCEACHSDAHDGFFDAALAAAGAAPGGTCATCHDSHGFDHTVPERFAHGDWTAFELRGAHAQGACEECHISRPKPDDHGRTFGLVEEQFGPVGSCGDCHLDPHEGHFDRPGLPARVPNREGGREDCARCHAQTSFRTLPHGFDHGVWGGYPLEGAHASAECSACHAPIRKPKRVSHPKKNTDHGRTWEHAKGTGCGDCHEDSHAGQFERGGTTSCERCHYSATSFSYLAFDHGRDSRFPLDEAHAKLECSACHTADSDQPEVIRYRPLGRDCADCHSPGEDVLGGTRGVRRGR